MLALHALNPQLQVVNIEHRVIACKHFDSLSWSHMCSPHKTYVTFLWYHFRLYPSVVLVRIFIKVFWIAALLLSLKLFDLNRARHQLLVQLDVLT